MANMYSTIVHIVEGDSLSSMHVDAPGYAEAADVMTALMTDRGIETPTTYTARNFARATPAPHERWFEWCTRSPVTVIEQASALACHALPEVERKSVSVLAGPDSGFYTPWTRSDFTVGRSHEATLQLFDPHMSRAPNPVAPAPAATLTTLGATHLGTHDPRNRTTPPEPLAWPAAPRVTAPRAPHLAHYAIPIVLGVVLMLVTHMWWFLLFSVAGPLSAGVMWWSSRRRYARDLTQALQEFSRAVEQFESDIRTNRARAASAENQRPFSLSRIPVGVGTCCVGATVKAPPEYEPPFDRVAARVDVPGITRDGHTHLVSNNQVVTVDLECTELVVCGESAPEVARGIIVTLRACDAAVVFDPPPDGPEFLRVGVAASGPVITVTWGDTIRFTPAEMADTWIVDCPDSVAANLHCPPPLGAGPVPGRIAPRCMPAHRFVRVLGGAGETGAVTLASMSVEELTRVASHDSRSAVPVGVSESGAVFLDLFADGPHALVAGTTGSGKSVFLSAWIQSLATALTPEEVRFVLVDFKGGAAFAPLQDLPHTDTVVSNLDTFLGLRALRYVLAEVTRREELFARAGVSDLPAYNENNAPLPRIVTVIDEFQALVHQIPESVEILEQLTALGRSLGIHAVLATQRPSGVVTARMKSNISMRVCLRVRDTQDSNDVIDSPEAARLDASAPGLGLISTPHGLTLFRSAHTGPPEPAVMRWRPADTEDAPQTEVLLPGYENSVLQTVNTGGDEVSHHSPGTTPHTIVPPPLPRIFDGTASAVFDTSAGLTPWTYQPDRDGAVLISGGPRCGKTHALHVLAGHASNTHVVVGFGRQGTSMEAAHVYANTEWMHEAALSLLESLPSSHSVFVAVDDSDDLFSPTHRARLDLVLAHRPFALVTGRRGVASAVATRASTRLTFPPAVAADAVFYGVKPARFAGMKDPGRGLLSSPSIAASDGVDAQVSTRVPFTLRPVPDVGSGILVGTSPLGNAVYWDPATGPVLNVLGPDHATAPLLAGLSEHLPRGTAVVPRAHEDSWEFGELTVVASPLDHMPGYGSPLAQARARGPMLIVGARSPQELGHVARDLPFIPPHDSCAWFVHANVRVPVHVSCSTRKPND
ncbi:MAG: FtsK/SpoIIIE domain-containing protein [Brevibacterium sp. UMB1308B]|nr:FtsK/SpoIIIE domain-containing protein [Brevibacterium sp. UMB1308B]